MSGGGELVRPRGCELMAYEGEIAVIIGRRARGVSVERAADHIGWLAPANDVGVHDFRWADRGSGVLAKGHDGFTPIGPAMPAAGVARASAARSRISSFSRSGRRGGRHGPPPIPSSSSAALKY